MKPIIPYLFHIILNPYSEDKYNALYILHRLMRGAIQPMKPILCYFRSGAFLITKLENYTSSDWHSIKST